MKPSVVVTAADLDKIGTRVPEFYAGDLFCPVGKTPLYLGQPVALLIFEKFDAFDQARLALRDGTFVKFGEETGPVVMPNYGAFRFTRVAGRDARCARCLFADPGRLGQSGTLPELGASDLVAARKGHGGAPTPRPRPMASRSAPNLRRKSGAAGARPRVRDAIRRSDVSRAGEPASPGTTRAAKASSSCSACSRPTRRRKSIAYLLGEARAPVQAGAHQCAVCLYRRRLRRTRPYAVPALCGAGGDVLPRPSGAAGA